MRTLKEYIGRDLKDRSRSREYLSDLIPARTKWMKKLLNQMESRAEYTRTSKGFVLKVSKKDESAFETFKQHHANIQKFLDEIKQEWDF